MSYDVQCEQLALHFLQDYKDVPPGTARDLAQAIQDAVEDFLCDFQYAYRSAPECPAT